MKQKLRLFSTLLLLAVASVAWGDTYEQLTSIANIDESAQYVLGDAEKGFHYSGTSDWGMIAQPNVQTPLYYTLKKGSDGTTFTAVTTIEEQEYYLTVPTAKTFTMSTSETSIGMATGGGIKNATSTTVWLIRVNTNLRAYSSATGSVAHFYKVVSDGVATTTTAINVPADFNTDVHTSTTAGQLTATVSANGTAISGATITWESSNENVATIDADGNVTLVAEGTTTITATYAGVDGQYEGSSDTYELTVTDSTPFEGGDVTFDATADKGSSPLTKKVVTLTASNGVLDNGTEYRFYKSSATTISVPEGYYISQIVFTCTAEDQALYGPGCFSLTNTQPGVYSYSGNEGTWIGNATSVTFTASLNQVRATQIVVTVGSGTVKADPELSFSAATATATLGEAFTAPTLTNSHELSVSYSSSNENVATVDETTGAVALVDAGETTITATFAGNDTYSAGAASYTLTVNAPAVAESDWVKAELSSLTEGDVFVIVGNKGNNYALANDKGTSAAPTAVSVTVNGDYLTSEVADNIKWNVSGNATDGYTFYPNGSTTTWLYCTNTNNGVRVGTGEAKVFTQTTNSYLTTTQTTDQRYIGIYNSQDWRCYTSEGGNIANQTFAFYKYTGAKAPSITAEAVEIAYDATSGSISYTIKNAVDGGTLTATSSENWLTVGTPAEGSIALTCEANNETSERTATVTLTYTFNEGETVTKEVTVTQAAAPVVYTTIPALFDAATSTATAVNVTFGGWIISAVNGNNAYLTDNEGHGLIIYNTNDHGFNVGDVLTGTASCKLQLYRGSAELTALTSTTEGLTVTSNGSVTTILNIAMNELGGVNTGALVKYEKLTYNGSALEDAQGNTLTPYKSLYEGTFEEGALYTVTGIYVQYNDTKEILPRSAADIVELIAVTFSENAKGKGTSGTAERYLATLYYGDKNLKMVGTNLGAYPVKVENGKIKNIVAYLSNRGDVIPAGTGVLLNAEEPGTYYFEVVGAPSYTAPSDNMLRGTDEAATTYAGEGKWKYYALSLNSSNTPGTAGFYFRQGCPNGEAFTNGAHKAYLAVPADVAGDAKSFTFGDDTDGIRQIENGELTIENAEIYNLSGQRVNKAQKGIYIVNGKKVVIR